MVPGFCTASERLTLDLFSGPRMTYLEISGSHSGALNAAGDVFRFLQESAERGRKSHSWPSSAKLERLSFKEGHVVNRRLRLTEQSSEVFTVTLRNLSLWQLQTRKSPSGRRITIVFALREKEIFSSLSYILSGRHGNFSTIAICEHTLLSSEPDGKTWRCHSIPRVIFLSSFVPLEAPTFGDANISSLTWSSCPPQA